MSLALLPFGRFMASVSIIKLFPEVFQEILQEAALQKAEAPEKASLEVLFYPSGLGVPTGTSCSHHPGVP